MTRKAIYCIQIILICSGCVSNSLTPSKDIDLTIAAALEQTISAIPTRTTFYTPSPTITETVKEKTKTAKPSRTPDLPKPENTPTSSSTPTPSPTKTPSDDSSLTVKEPKGHIVFRWRRSESAVQYEDRPYDELVMIDGDGDNLIHVGRFFSGPPAWSPSGNYIAVGCDNTKNSLGYFNYGRIANHICVIDPEIPFQNKYFPKELTYGISIKTIEYIKHIPLPKACLDIKPSDRFIDEGYYYGIASLSWSYDETRFAVICGTGGHAQEEHQLLTCIISQEGDSDCWDSELGNTITRAVWSPKEDLLAVSTVKEMGPKIYLVNPDGSDPVFLAEGWNPEWSPDGERIAYFKPKEGTSLWGISIINKDGSNPEWVFQESAEEYIYLSIFCTEQCPITWSPDGNFLAFIATYQSSIRTKAMYRLDINTGEMVYLLDYFLFENGIYSPDWGP